jgi:hypothetical protein
LAVSTSSRHHASPVAGFKELIALGVHTINCRRPPAVKATGEL